MIYKIKKNKFSNKRFFSIKKPKSPKIKGQKFRTHLTLKKKSLVSGGLRKRNLFKTSYNNYPLISVIIPNLNGKFLDKTINSVLKQKYPNIEIIVIDGGSDAKNISCLNTTFKNEIDYWISEKDKGIYDGWNKGLKLCFGDYIGIINSNDYYYENAFYHLVKYIKKYPNHDFILGAVKKHKVYAGFRPLDIKFNFNIYPSTVIGFFIKLNSQKKLGIYDIQYKCSSDYDLFYRMIVKEKMLGVPTKANEVFGKFELGGYSSTLSFFDHLNEEIKIRYNNGQNFLLLLYIYIGRSLIKFFFYLKKKLIIFLK